MAKEGIQDGFAAPFYRVYYKGEEIKELGDRFSYAYDEEDDDECIITVRLENPRDVDKPQFQEKAELQVIWGYIQGETKTRKVYVHNAIPSFNKDLITLTLECSEKAAITLKGSTERTIYRDQGLLGVVADKAEKHGLVAQVELPDDYGSIVLDVKVDTKTGKMESREEFIKRLNYAAHRKRQEVREKEWEKDPNKLRADIKNFEELNKERFKYERRAREEVMAAPAGVVDVEAEVQRRAALYRGMDQLKNMQFSGDHNLPQAGKGDKQFIKDIAKRTRGGETVVETRDDKIILRKRNFNQPPYRSYTYGGTEGILLEFKPETKNKQGRGASNSMGFGGWNPLSKTFFKGDMDPTNPTNDPALAKALGLIAANKIIQKHGGGKTKVGERYVAFETLTFFDPGSQNPQTDRLGRENTANRPTVDKVRRAPDPAGIKVDITVDDQTTALQRAVDNFTGQVKSQQKDFYNALGVNPDGAINDASNRRESNELKMNPATVQIWGDPFIETGILITIQNASKKHSGNYYITKSVHTIDKGSGYITDIEACKSGHNIVSSDDYVKADRIGRKPNTRTGQTTKPSKTKNPKIRTNAPKQN